MRDTHRVATFWHGPALSPLDEACLLSFVANGFDVALYSFGGVPNLSAEIAQADAGEIVDPRFLNAFRIEGRPSLSHFSDLFRYNLFARTDRAWVDTDLLCLRRFEIPRGNFFSKETATGLNGAVLRIDGADPRLQKLIDYSERIAVADRFRWGATGPGLITSVFGDEALATAQPIERFYPIHWTEWWKPFLPRYTVECEAACADTDALHMWNNIVEKAGYWKALAPPRGSFVHRRLDELGLLGAFAGVYPEPVVDRLRINDQHLRSADHMPITTLGSIFARRVKRRLLDRGGDAGPGIKAAANGSENYYVVKDIARDRDISTAEAGIAAVDEGRVQVSATEADRLQQLRRRKEPAV